MSEATGWGITLANIIAIGAAAGAFIFSGFTYRHNRKSEQIKIAREEMDRISLLLGLKWTFLSIEI